MMVKAGSLYYAIMICVLVGICCAAFMLTSHYSKIHAMLLQTHSNLLDVNSSGINYYLDRVQALNNGSEKVDLFENGMFTEGKTTDWGFYKILQVSSTFKKDTVVRHAMLGKKNKNQFALYLVDNEKPLQMVGKAKIKGDAYLPKEGIKNGYITTQSFNSYTFLEGNILRSENKLPDLTNIFNVPDTLGVDKLALEEIEKGEEVYQDFSENMLHIVADSYYLNNTSLLNKVLISSKDSLYIGKNNKLEDVIIMAPIVVFEKGFKGTVQVISNEKVELEEEVVLKYPSGIFLEGNHLNNRKVIFNSDSRLLGNVVVKQSQVSSKAASLITINKDAQIIGNVLCNGNTELRGNITGTLYTDKFYLKTKASTYENFIEDGTIDCKALSEDFLGGVFIMNNKVNERFGVIKML